MRRRYCFRYYLQVSVQIVLLGLTILVISGKAFGQVELSARTVDKTCLKCYDSECVCI